MKINKIVTYKAKSPTTSAVWQNVEDILIPYIRIGLLCI